MLLPWAWLPFASQDAVQRAPRSLRRGDVGGVMQRIKGDFNKNAYIITGGRWG